MQRIGYAALLAACVLVVASPADARRHSRHLHHQKQVNLSHRVVCDQWGCSDRILNRVSQPIRAKRHHVATEPVAGAFSGGGGLIAKARAYNGMTASQIGLRRRSLWCAAFLRFLGVEGPVDDRAISFAKLHRVSPQVGAIAVYRHHVGIVTGFSEGYPVLISGNSNGRRVYEGVYPRHPIAYVSPG